MEDRPAAKEGRMNQGIHSAFTSKNYTAWALIKAYWQSNYKLSAYLFTFTILLFTVSLVVLDVVFNHWYNHFYNALQDYDKHSAIDLLVIFFAIAGIYIVVAVYRYYIYSYFGLRWRRWLTDQLIARWLQNKSYYLLENFDESTDNPDQRIQEDAGAIVAHTIELTIGFVTATTTLFAFVFILWKLSGVLTLPLGPLGTYHIPGYLVWVGVVYAFIGSFFAVKIGQPLVALNFEQQRREATFRFAAVDLRQHTEHVALYKGEKQQQGILGGLFNRVLENYYAIILRQKLLLWFTAGYNQVSVVLPLIVALPNYFNKVFMLGGLIQTLGAFGKVQDALSFFVNAYARIAEWQAVARRLTTFINHMNEADEKAKRENKVVFTDSAADIIATNGLTITTPDNELLLSNVNQTLQHGQHYLIKGASGIGKSTFVRTIAGIWPFAAGNVSLPSNKSVMYLPQKPYMPIGTLLDAIMFPDRKAKDNLPQIEEILRDCNLEKLIPRLNETAPWSQQLSPGEQQRIAFARVLLQKPDWVFLDESTSSMDVKNEEHLYKLMKSKLPNCSIVSVGHRPTIDGYHDHVINMTEYSPGAV
jgi:putative ATP-binding cassette transporter